MIPNNPYGIIKLGNSIFECIIFQVDENNNSHVLSSSTTKSQGIHNGVVVNLKDSSRAIRLCISAAEKIARISLKKINLVIEQPEFLCTKFSKYKKINGNKIHKDDIDFLLKDAKKQVALNDKQQSIIHIFNYNYIVDEKFFSEEPIGVYADFLRHEVTFITAPKNNIKNLKEAFIDCDIEIERFISCTFALSVQLLTFNELKSGAILIDVGSEKISIGLFKNLALIYSITLPVGVHHIAKDISKVCSLTIEESEKILNDFDFSFNKNIKIFDNTLFLKDNYFETSTYRKISKELITNIIKDRLDEMFQMIQKQLTFSGANQTALSNILITGGGANLFNLDEYFSNFFKSNIKKAGINTKTVNSQINEEGFESCLGALIIIKDGWETEAIPRQSTNCNEKISFFEKIFRNRE